MLQPFQIISVTHKTATLRQVARFVIPHSDAVELSGKLTDLKQQSGVQELYYLATCNRVIFGFYHKDTFTQEKALAFLRLVNPELQETEMFHCRIMQGDEAIAHLHEVSASLDSLVLGEREILRQVRDAYEFCQQLGLCGDNWRILMQSVVAAAKAVYTESSIGEKPVSVVSLACEQVRHWGLPKNARVLVIGAGQTNTTVVKFLAKHQFTNVTIFNRSVEKAETLSKLLNGSKALPISELTNFEAGFDCLFVCTGATEPIITKEVYQHLLQEESGEKYIIDLSVPHNVSIEVSELEQVQYLSVEALQVVAQENLSFRQESVGQAKEIIGAYLSAFEPALRQRWVEISLRDVPTRIQAVRKHAMEQVFKKRLEGLDQPALELINDMLFYMEKQCTGIPMQVAKSAILIEP